MKRKTQLNSSTSRSCSKFGTFKTNSKPKSSGMKHSAGAAGKR